MMARLAAGANTVEFVLVRSEFESVLVSDVLLQFFDARLFEFDDVPALDANEVIVVRGVVGEFITSQSVAEAALVGDAAFGEKLEGAIDGGVADPRVLFAHLGEQLFDADVIFGTKKRLDDESALICGPQALFDHVRLQNPAEMLEFRRRAIRQFAHQVSSMVAIVADSRAERTAIARRKELQSQAGPCDSASTSTELGAGRKARTGSSSARSTVRSGLGKATASRSRERRLPRRLMDGCLDD
jgi:hypothetical protein